MIQLTGNYSPKLFDKFLFDMGKPELQDLPM